MTVVFAVVLIVFGFALGRRSCRSSATDPYAAAARAYCRARFNYDNSYVDADGRDAHIDRDARDTATEPWLRAVVDAALGREDSR